VALAAAAVIAGCGGHSSGGATGAAATGATGSAPPPVLKVVSVTPHKLHPSSSISVTFTQPLTSASALPTLKPAVPGSWARQGATAVFTPARDYPPDTAVSVSIVKKPGAASKQVATRMTPHGSMRRAEQILAHLHYIPLATEAATPATPAAEAAAVYNPPPGKFRWRYSNVPATLRDQWREGGSNEVVRGAVVAFQHQTGLPVDASIGQHTWRALIAADLADKADADHYSYVSADLYLPQRLSVWVDGHTVLTSPVNGGVAGAPTPLGTFPVYERFTSTTMSGTNPSGSHYSDPGVPWVNYFSGGSAVHGFPRASYGTPQSVGCLELPIPTAKTVFGMIDYGTLVTVSGPQVSSAPSATPSPPSSNKPSGSPSPKPSHSHNPSH
jgi:lipoprotein-anchoring transpeptidase ErfK/SrfK